MSLYGALFSGVSGLVAQSSAMGAISDNITNVSTIGYKNTAVSFQTLVTKQTSSTFYSAGGVQSKPLQATDVQGLLQASTSQSDISISGSGFFVVNEASVPTISNQFLYTRAGGFTQDNDGFLKNTAGFYLQGWPVTAAGVVKPANTNLTIANQNIISTDYLSTVNLNRVGGTASATTSIAIGANLPSNDTAGVTHKTDVQFFDTLGNANTVSYVYTKTTRENQWDLQIQPPSGTSTLALEDSSGKYYDSWGQLEFTGTRPAEGSTVVIEGISYIVDTNASVAENATTFRWVTTGNTTLAQDVASLVAEVKAHDTDFTDYGSYTNTRIAVSSGSTTTVVFHEDGSKAVTVNPVGLKDTNGASITKQTSAFTVALQDQLYTDFRQLKITTLPANNDVITINGTAYTFSTGEADDATGSNATISIDVGSTVATMLADLEAAIEAQDSSFAGTAVRVRKDANSATNDTLVLSSISSGSYNVALTTWTNAVPVDPGGAVTYAAATNYAVDTAYAIQFGADGLPAAFNVKEIQITDYSNGAADMDDAAANSPQITMDFGTVDEANGMTQFGAEFTPVFITQNGSQFGTFAGVTISTDGLVTALFDNGEIRHIYKLPMATFVNPNQLGSRTGNVWNATEASGDYTLRVADNGPAGQVTQAALEASTVDIGTEFTNMIVVQRAYSASTKIISTADEMLEELMRTKR